MILLIGTVIPAALEMPIYKNKVKPTRLISLCLLRLHRDRQTE